MIPSSAPTTDPTEERDQWSMADSLSVAYLVFGLLGILGNGLVLFVFIRVKSLRNITNLFIGNQSLIDLVSSVFLLISKYRNEETDFGELGRSYGLIVCILWTSDYIYWTLLVASTANLVVITLERYVAVSRPLIYRQRVNWKTASVVAVGVWVFGLIVQIFWPAVHRVNGGKCYPDWRSRWIQAVVGIIVFAVKLIIPAATMILVYMSILRKLFVKVAAETTTRREETATGNGPAGVSGISRPRINEANLGVSSVQIRRGTRNRARENDIHRKIRTNVVKTLFLVSFVYIICWTPNQVIFLLYNMGIYALNFNGAVYSFGVSLAFCNAWINPFIYAFKYRGFQKGLRSVVCLRSSGESGESTNDTTARGPTL